LHPDAQILTAQDDLRLINVLLKGEVDISPNELREMIEEERQRTLEILQYPSVRVVLEYMAAVLYLRGTMPLHEILTFGALAHADFIDGDDARPDLQKLVEERQQNKSETLKVLYRAKYGHDEEDDE
jgi:hypothetical protein